MIPKGCELVIGFDHAVSGRDESVAWVGGLIPGIAGNKMPAQILMEHDVRVWLHTYIHDQVVELSGLYPTGRYCIDATAEGGKEALGEFRRAGLDTLGVDFGKSKPVLMIGLKNSMQQGLVKFWDEKLRVQLSHYKFQESKTLKGRYKYGEPGTPDDRVDAFALAAYRAFLLRTYGGAESAILFAGDHKRLDHPSDLTFL